MISFRIALLISLLTLGFGAPVIAEDLSDPATCLDCHEKGGRMDWKALGYEKDPMD